MVSASCQDSSPLLRLISTNSQNQCSNMSDQVQSEPASPHEMSKWRNAPGASNHDKTFMCQCEIKHIQSLVTYGNYAVELLLFMNSMNGSRMRPMCCDVLRPAPRVAGAKRDQGCCGSVSEPLLVASVQRSQRSPLSSTVCMQRNACVCVYLYNHL